MVCTVGDVYLNKRDDRCWSKVLMQVGKQGVTKRWHLNKDVKLARVIIYVDFWKKDVQAGWAASVKALRWENAWFVQWRTRKLEGVVKV